MLEVQKMFQVAESTTKMMYELVSLTKHVDSLSTQLACMRWAFGIIVTIIIAYGLGNGWTFLKISDREKAKIENEIAQLPSKATAQKIENAVLALNGWTVSQSKQNYITITNFGNLTFYKIHVTLQNDNVTERFNNLMQTPDNIKIPTGVYPAYYVEERKWITLNFDPKIGWLTYDVLPNKSATICVNLTEQFTKQS